MMIIVLSLLIIAAFIPNAEERQRARQWQEIYDQRRERD